MSKQKISIQITVEEPQKEAPDRYVVIGVGEELMIFDFEKGRVLNGEETKEVEKILNHRGRFK